jgi:peptidoglycan/LPS O-acetylase OafA/YrhL
MADGANSVADRATRHAREMDTVRQKPAPTKERLAAIDALRGVAALAVVLYHFVGFIPLNSIPVGGVGDFIVAATRYGYLGVEVFFVLSGYVIAMTAARYAFSPRVGAKFVLRRLVRIVPPYWFVVFLTAGTLVVGKAAGYFGNTPVSTGQVAAHLVYAQDVLGYVPLDDAYWTLCLEVQFYFVFAGSMIALARFPAGAQVWWFAALTIGSMVLDATDAVSRDWCPRLWYQFGAGVLAFHARQERWARWPWMLTVISLAALGIHRGRDSDFVVVAIAGLLPLAGCVNWLSSVCPGFLVRLGGISYSLYLIHGYVGKGLDVVFRASLVRTEAAAWLVIAGGVLAALVSATALYHWCERRAIDWSHRVRIA